MFKEDTKNCIRLFISTRIRVTTEQTRSCVFPFLWYYLKYNIIDKSKSSENKRRKALDLKRKL